MGLSSGCTRHAAADGLPHPLLDDNFNILLESARVGITSGIGLFIAMMGLKNIGLVVANPATLVSMGI